MTRIDEKRGESFNYHVYGLGIQSELALPELATVASADPDVTICFGKVPSEIEAPLKKLSWVEYDRGSCLMRIPGVGRFLIEDGRRITVDRREDRSGERGTGAPSADVRLYLLGSAFGALLHQRGCLPLHVSAVASPGGVWAFTGQSGAGKSTIAGWLHRKHDWSIMSDDVSVIRPELDHLVLYHGPRKLKLWDDAVDYLNCRNEDLVQDLSNTPKYQLYLKDKEPLEPSILRALVLLERCSPNGSAGLTQLSGIEAFDACMSAVYRPYMAEWFRDSRDVMADLLTLSKRIDVYSYRRRWSLDHLDEDLKPLIKEVLTTSETLS